jgi:hypothetical protein
VIQRGGRAQPTGQGRAGEQEMLQQLAGQMSSVGKDLGVMAQGFLQSGHDGL